MFKLRKACVGELAKSSEVYFQTVSHFIMSMKLLNWERKNQLSRAHFHVKVCNMKGGDHFSLY